MKAVRSGDVVASFHEISAGEQPAAQFITVGGAFLEMRYWEGRELPILLLHEGLGSVSLWRDFPAQLATATGRKVIAWSRRGHGHSDALPTPRDLDYMHREADLIPKVLKACGIERAHLFGHSDGASIALLAAAAHPALIASLTLEAPHVFVEPVTLEGIAAAKTAYQTTDLRDRLARYHAEVDHTFWRWNDIWLDARFRGWNIESCLSALSAPTLLVQGLDDEYGTMEQLDRIQAVLDDSKRLELEGCKHSPHRDRLDAVLPAVTHFLEDLA
jgi:pimeloyl-ACP methyl ester carboxylesterase